MPMPAKAAQRPTGIPCSFRSTHFKRPATCDGQQCRGAVAEFPPIHVHFDLFPNFTQSWFCKVLGVFFLQAFLAMPSTTTYGDEIEMLNRPDEYASPIGGRNKVANVVTTLTDVHSTNSIEHEDESNTDPTLQVSKSTHADAAGMKRMGKKQQFVRHFRLVSTVSFVALCTASWEIGLFVLTPGLINGGRAGLVWNVLWNIICFGPIYLSMAEVSWPGRMKWEG